MGNVWQGMKIAAQAFNTRAFTTQLSVIFLTVLLKLHTEKSKTASAMALKSFVHLKTKDFGSTSQSTNPPEYTFIQAG